MTSSLAQRIEDNSHPVPFSGCLIWLGCTMNGGYGRIKVGKKTLAAHRASYSLANGSIPEGLFVCHRCDVPSCVNPDHLFIGTQVDNMADMVAKDRGRGHPGETNPKAKLSRDDVDFLRKKKMKQAEYAALFCVSVSTVKRAQWGATWKEGR